MGADWAVEERRGTAAGLHAGWTPADPDRPTVALCRVTAPAVVLGSTQRGDVVDADRARAAGVAVVRRRSGGGAVLVTPDDPVWIDAWIPRGGPLWHEDVSLAFSWLGTAWAEALAILGHPGASAHRGAYASCTRWSSLVCFGGVGAGEVVVPDGRKVVGLAQRRSRPGAWFHSACVLRWEPSALLDVLDLPGPERETARRELAAAVVGVDDLGGAPVGRAAAEAALLARLP
jgi:lipoate-protein ligase A